MQHVYNFKSSFVKSQYHQCHYYLFFYFCCRILRRVNKALHHFSIWNWWLKLWVVSWCRTKIVKGAVMLGNAAAACFVACLTYFTSYVRRLLCKTTLSCYSSNQPDAINSPLIFFSRICSGNYFGLHIMSFLSNLTVFWGLLASEKLVSSNSSARSCRSEKIDR